MEPSTLRDFFLSIGASIFSSSEKWRYTSMNYKKLILIRMIIGICFAIIEIIIAFTQDKYVNQKFKWLLALAIIDVVCAAVVLFISAVLIFTYHKFLKKQTSDNLSIDDTYCDCTSCFKKYACLRNGFCNNKLNWITFLCIMSQILTIFNITLYNCNCRCQSNN